MNIDFANLKIAYQEHQQEFDAAVLAVMQNSNYIMGNEITILEENLSQFSGAKYAISCSSGTDALLLALMALDIQPGDEVITSPFTFIATGEMIALLKAKPVFVDIDPVTYNIDAAQIEDKITERTKAIMPVSIFGQMSDMGAISKIADKFDLPVIEDAAQSFGATQDGVTSCNASTIGCTSFFPAKPLGCFGDGGAIFTNDEDLSLKIKSLRLHGQTERYYHKYIGIGGRLDTLQAAVLNVKLKYYSKDIAERQRVVGIYNKLLKDVVITPELLPVNTSVWAQYSIRVQDRKDIQQKLATKNIPTAVHYPVPLHLQECFSYLGYVKGDFQVAEKISDEIMSLPMNPYLTAEEIEYITQNLKSII